MGRKQREKGARGELRLRDELGRVFAPATFWREGWKQRRGAEDTCDVEMRLPDGTIVKVPWFAECKFYAGQHATATGYRQAARDTDGRVPVVFTKDTTRGREPWLVTMTLDDWAALVRGELDLDPRKRLPSGPRVRRRTRGEDKKEG